ncbi:MULTISPECIES: restriction endonuclease [Sphingobium]|uniref:nSTAND3 domain-containing NTPase n=1 Tax=Sphingobium TaxID=165695 RepID=UPI00159BFF2C|nr:restriction endonuclease [Sphingobium sp. 15-1]
MNGVSDIGADVQLRSPDRAAVGPWSDLALHTIGWRAFQDLCSQICEVMLHRPVEIFREAQDGGQDAVFLIPADDPASPSIGTVQCKHTSDAGKALRSSDLNAEVDHVRELVAQGQADTYIFMTNMGVDAGVAMEIRARLRELGVRKPHILGRQYVVRTIRSSARLRALVPQVYGLGDLTAIIDERLTQQSRALLDNWIPKLKTYVPTRAHRDAVRAIGDHGIVLLLGNPSSGKSAIGAIISTIASENPNNTVLALTSPRDFEAGWNPSDPGRFFWIDDAFGSNQVREDFVQDWTSAFAKLRAAIGHGNRFLLTSRKHIYEAARRRLGQRNLPFFADGRAVVDVGALTAEEKAQILYNHVNYGGQTQSWKSSVKPHLDAVAAVEEFLPGIAERLGDPNFTKSLAPREASLVRFMREPREHLIDTVNALEPVLQAALILVYVHQGAFKITGFDQEAATAVAELTRFCLPQIQDAFADLKGSFLKASGSGTATIWTFAHPTIADALTEILSEKPFMMAALLRGATIDTVLSGFTCEGARDIPDALSIPPSLDDTLVERLALTPDEIDRTWSLFIFLAYRASDVVFEKLIRRDPDILKRNTWATTVIANSPKMVTHGRAHRARLLNDDLRECAADALESAAINEFDLSFFDNSAILELIPADRLVRLGMTLRAQRLPEIDDRISEIANDADLDEDPESHFEKIAHALTILEDLKVDDDGADLIDDARMKIKRSIEHLEERKEERDKESEDDADWSHIVTTSSVEDASIPKPAEKTARSIFDDVDCS